MTKWQMLSLIFIYLGTAYFADFLLSKHPFAFKSSFLLKITRFWRVLSKMAYSTIIQNGGSKTADASTSFLSNKWRHHDITAFVKLANFLILWNTLLFVSIFHFMCTLREIWILPINFTIWRHNDVRLRHCVN